MTRTRYVIPVDPTQTAEEAWSEQQFFGERVTDSGLGEYWAVIEVDEDEDAPRRP